MRLIAILILAASSWLSLPADAQEPPARVGRLAYAEGSVAAFRDPESGWEKAYVNAPLTSENSLWTDPDARAEMRVSGTAVRLDELTQLDIARLDDRALRAFVPRGSVSVRVRHFEGRYRIAFATPHARFRLNADGRYRIDVDPDREETLFTVFAGSATIRSAAGDVKVEAGGAVRVFGEPEPSFVRERARTTEFDRWAMARDERWVERTSVRYVSSYMTGYEELDVYGDWYVEPEFGPIWFPARVDRDWAPYRDGHWDWISPWGWTWIGYEPWGYAPYHYGRWVYVRDRWGWHPGPRRVERPVWAPALVAWVGGSNFSVRIGTGAAPAVGWYPLAPWERYQPWYPANTTYVNQVNIVVRDNPPRRFQGRGDWRHFNRERAATVVRRDQFIDRRPVAQAVVPVTAEVLRQAQVAMPTNLISREEVRRRRVETRSSEPAPFGGAPRVGGSPATAPQAAPQPGREASPTRRAERAAPAERPTFQQREAPAPRAATAPPARAAVPGAPADSPFARRPAEERRDARGQDRERERGQREAQQQQERAARETQQQARERERGQREAQQQERAAREAQQQQERAARDVQQQARERERQQREAQQQQERAQRDAQQQARDRERTQREAQQQQERAAREAQQQARERERAQREAQQQQQRAQQQQQAQERAQREAQQQQRAQQQQQQAQERAQREAQQQQQRAQQQQQQAQQRAQREAQQQQQRAQQQQQQAQQRAQREAQQQQAQERAQREAQQQQARAQREAQQAAARAQREQPKAPPPQAQPQPQPQAQPPAQGQAPARKPEGERGRGRDRDRDDDDKEKGKGRGREAPGG